MNTQSRKGDCEVCDAMDIEVFMVHNNILMCESCRAKEQAAVKMLADSRAIDSSITLKTDILLAKTVAVVELRAAVDNNSEIPADQKDYVFTAECFTRFQKLQKTIFEKRAELLEIENEMRAWQVNTQTAAGKLRAELRAHFKELDVNYQPQPITKKQKTTKPVTSSSSFSSKDKAALYEAAKKYNLPVTGVQSLKLSRPDKTYDEVAKELATMMGTI